MSRLLLPLCSALLFSTPPTAAAEESLSGRGHLSVRANGLVRHFFDVSADAPWYPNKLDDAGAWVLNPGVVVAWDEPLPLKWLPFLRVSLGAYADCAAEPAGYLGIFPLFPEFSTRHFTFAGGIGLGLALRRNWSRGAIPDHRSDTFSDWGAVEGAIGPFGELDFRFHPADRRWEAVVSVVPGYPYVAVMSAGVRMPL